MKLLLGGGTLGTILYVLGLPLLSACGGTTESPVVQGSGGSAGSGGAAATGGIGVTGGATAAGGTGGAAGSDSSCNIDIDCAWGEIGHEITKRADCLCLFGCPGLIQNTTTATRRQAQYAALCDPRTDGQGQPCPIDDCMMPPPLVCLNGQCAVASADAGAGGAGGAGGATAVGGAGAASGAGGTFDASAGRCGRTGDTPCPASQFCELPVGCVAGTAGGTCLAKPQMCTMIYAPVCGCDNVTYGNDCSRQGTGQPKKADGACK
jgi:hypothetical protein